MEPQLTQNKYLHLGVPRKPLVPRVRRLPQPTGGSERGIGAPGDESGVNDLV